MAELKSANEFQYIKVPIKDNKKDIESDSTIPPAYGYGIRHVQLFIFFCCLSMGFLSRGHLGVTLVAMINHKDIAIDTRNIINAEHNYTYFNKTVEMASNNDNVTKMYNITQKTWSVYTTYDWPKPVQEMVLSAFFLGYCIMMLPIGFVCERWGGKVPLQISMFVNSIVSLGLPWLALWGGWKAVCACRVLQGLSQAGTFPGIQTLLAQWVPDSERATLSSYVYTGSTVGSIIGFQMAGLLSEYYGWPVTFWLVGALCLLTFAVLTLFGASSPLVFKNISQEEKLYILGTRNSNPFQKKRAPYKAILTSKPIWSNFATEIGSGVAYMYFLTQMPSYIHYIRGIDVKSSGLLSSLPYLVSFFFSLSYGVVSDYLTNSKIVSIKNARRIFNTYSQVGLATALVCASYSTTTTSTIICLVVAMTCQLATYTGYMVNQIDLAPNYTGTVMSIGNTLTSIFGMVIPIMSSNIVTDVRNPYQWRIMIYVIAGIAFFCNLVFVFLMSADVQPWNYGDFTEGEPLDTIKRKEEKEKS